MATTIIGTRLQDETRVDFLVVSVPWESVATPQAAEDTLLAFLHFQFPFVLATRSPDGQWNYLGNAALTMCESKLGQNPNWQEIPVSFPNDTDA